jgi:hypothetical protein
MLEILRNATIKAPSIETCDLFRALTIVGPSIHWGDSSYIQQSSWMDPDDQKLFYQVDRSYL